MSERRKPLILSSTRALLDSVISPASSAADGNHLRATAPSHPSVRLRVGILRFSESDDGIGSELHESSQLVGVSSSVLKRLSVITGSLALIKNADMDVGRLVKILALDRPALDAIGRDYNTSVNTISSQNKLCVFPSFGYAPNANLPFDLEVAYVTPLLAFNLGLHVSTLKVLCGDQELWKSLFGVGESTTVDGKRMANVNVDLVPWTKLPRYASHLRISFIKMPECGMLESLKGNSKIEADDRQDIIDSALNDYFKLDRYLTRGDIFYIHIGGGCNSEICTVCGNNSSKLSNNLIYFKVVALEPSDEPTLCVNRNHTALILGGSVASAIPPDFLLGSSSECMPLQGDKAKILASIIAPAMCPSVLSSKFRVSLLLHGPAGCGKRTVVRYIAGQFGMHVVEYSCHELTSSSERKAAAELTKAFKTAFRYSPCILFLRSFDMFGSLSTNDGLSSDQVAITSEVASVIREFTEPLPEDENLHPRQMDAGGLYFVEPERVSRQRVLLVASANDIESLPPSIRRCYSHEIKMGSLSEEQRLDMLLQTLKGVTTTNDEAHKDITSEFLKDIAGQTSGFMPRDLSALVADASANFIQRILNDNDPGSGRNYNDDNAKGFPFSNGDGSSSSSSHEHLGKEDFSKALERSKKRNASALGTPKVPNVKWEDVGGLEEVKKSILDTVQLPLIHKDLFSSGLRKRSGVLLYGPPGTGKTLLAKAVATECSLNFLSVKGPELINMYIGESEKNVRDIFQKARSARPCVIFFDELDSLAPARGASGDSGGVMDRVVSQMLAEIDGLSDSSQDLFIIGASNRPDLIDPALLRPGRFDKLLYVGVNVDASYRERVLTALTRKFKLHDSVSLLSIAKRCPPNFTGADMYALCADAWFHAAKRKISHSIQESSVIDEGDSITIEMDDFMKVLAELSPSLSLEELKKYEQLRDQFEGSLK